MSNGLFTRISMFPAMTPWKVILIWMCILNLFFFLVVSFFTASFISCLRALHTLHILHNTWRGMCDGVTITFTLENSLVVSWSPWTKCSFNAEQDHSWIADQINQCHRSGNDILRNTRVLSPRWENKGQYLVSYFPSGRSSTFMAFCSATFLTSSLLFWENREVRLEILAIQM